MRIVVVYTGALRTIKKTIRYLKQNVLGLNVDVFACVQNDTNESEDTWNEWFHQQLGDHLKDITWFSLEKYPEWIKLRDLQLNHLHITPQWKNYLKNSGSMIEYFQLQLAYMKMSFYEELHHFKYDYLIRGRTDSIYAKPIDFHWLKWTKEDITSRIEVIKEEMVLSKLEITSSTLFKYFMCTILSDDLIPNLSYIFADYTPSPTEIQPPIEDNYYDYIHNGRYILTLRKNNLYIVKRDLFHLIPTLGTMYGFMRSPISDNYWFNAECQFRDACYYSCLSIFEYSTLFEEKSLEYANKWNEADFFDMDFNCINPRMLYCVVRK
jgi:hypothetical protein